MLLSYSCEFIPLLLGLVFDMMALFLIIGSFEVQIHVAAHKYPRIKWLLFREWYGTFLVYEVNEMFTCQILNWLN